MGAISTPPVFLPTEPPIPFSASDIGKVLTVQSSTALGWGAGGGGGGLTARYTIAQAAGSYNNVNPGSSWPNSDVSARLIATPSGNVTWTGLVAGNDGELMLLWNNSSAYNISLSWQSASSSAANRFTFPGSSGSLLVITPQSGQLFCYDGTIALWLAAM